MWPDYGLEYLELNFHAEKEQKIFFLFSRASRPALVSIQSPIKWEHEDLSGL
jgi:hypothetical protein